MANKKTVALTKEQYLEIIETMHQGSTFFRPNVRIATCLVIEANIGLRIEDVLELRLNNIIRDGDRYRLDLVEQKTKKERTFTVPLQIYQYLELYCLKNGIHPDERIFPIGERNVQKYLKKVADFLGYENIGTHSFRKFFATDIYVKNNYDIMLVQKLLQHSSALNTQKYIGIQSAAIESALQSHVVLL